MATQKTPFASIPSLFDTLPARKEQRNNPVFLTGAGGVVYHGRKNDDEPPSRLTTYSLRRCPDNGNPVAMRALAGGQEPAAVLTGDRQARSRPWTVQLAAEAERVLRLALQDGTFGGL